MPSPLPDLALVQLVELAVGCFVGHEDEDGVAATLASLGLAPETIHELIAFVPSAFGHALLRHRELAPPETFVACDGDRRAEPKAFASEPIYRVAAELARSAPRETFIHLAEWSAEIHALRSAEGAGRSMAGARFLPPAMSLPHRLSPARAWWKLGAAAPRARPPDPPDWHGLGRVLTRALAAHGADARQDGAAAVSSTAGRWEARWFARVVAPDRVRAQVDFVVTSPIAGGRPICESFSAMGSDVRSAGLEAYDKFARGTLHVLLADVATAHACCAGQTELEAWGAWRARLGAALRLWQPEPALDLGAVLDAAKRAFLARGEATTRAHWIRIFVARGGSLEPTTEALLDDAPWPELATELERWPFPASATPYAVRHFTLLTPG